MLKCVIMRVFFSSLTIIIITMMSCKTSMKNNMSEKNLISFDSLLQNYYNEEMELYPLEATSAGDYRFNDKLPNNLTQAYRDDLRTFYSKYQQLLRLYDRNKLDTTDRDSYDILNWECDIHLEGLQFHKELFPVDQMWSLNLFIGQLATGRSIQPFRNIGDYENWLKRLDAFVAWCDTAIANMKKGIETGYVLPKSLIVKVIPEITSFTTEPVTENLFYSPVKSFPETVPPSERQKLKKDYAEMIEDRLIPVFERMVKFLKNQYLPAGRETAGIGSLPDGKEWYQYLIKYYTTTSLTPDEIFEIGEQEVARIWSEMDKVREQTGYQGDLKSFFNFIRTDKQLMPFTRPEQVIDHFWNIYHIIKPNMPKLFDIEPRARFEIRRTEAFREKSASAEYNPGSFDGSRPGIFYVPIPDVKKYNIYSDEDLFLHEVIPGHHFQISLQQENKKLPQFRKILWYSGYGEGWALYSESLGKELGLYKDPYQYFGMLSNDMHRAIRLVVDVGIHAKGWTREKAVQYSLDHEAESESSIISEVERYMANPGQALSYKIGEMKIEELKRKVFIALGPEFDIRKFHDIVLEPGCIPLDILGNKIDNWIKRYQE